VKCLIADDDLMSRFMLKEILNPPFNCDIAANGEEAIIAFSVSHDRKYPYKLICLDIEMPDCNGHDALFQIRQIEKQLGVPPDLEVKVIMITALDDIKSVFESFNNGASSYIVKPFDRNKIMGELRTLGLIA